MAIEDGTIEEKYKSFYDILRKWGIKQNFKTSENGKVRTGAFTMLNRIFIDNINANLQMKSFFLPVPEDLDN